MTDIASIVTRLIAAGAPADVAAVAVAEAFACGAASAASGGNPVDKAAERRREYDRNRKRDERERLRMSGGNPVDSGGSPKTALTLSSSHKESIEKKEKKVRARKISCPPDWEPNANHFAKADELRIPRSAVLSKAEDMRLWAQSTGAVKVDWDATFHGFLRRDAEKLRGKNEATGNVVDAADRLLERVRAFDQRPGGIRDGAGPDHVRLLSKG